MFLFESLILIYSRVRVSKPAVMARGFSNLSYQPQIKDQIIQSDLTLEKLNDLGHDLRLGKYQLEMCLATRLGFSNATPHF
ncbi:hypothetical protein J6590_043978 [Homalodisca vitripennis]|nr:hypothetical protein J6590_043978 [Homalodisca vitripennis]